MCKLMLKKTTLKYHQTMENIPKFNKRRTFNKALVKDPILINVKPTFIPDYRVHTVKKYKK